MSPRQTSHQGRHFLSAAAGRPRSARAATGMTVDQCHNLPLHLCPQPVFRAIRKCLRLCRDIHHGDTVPSGVLITKPHDSAGAHRRCCPESLILSLSWIYCESLLMERKPPKLATMPRISHPRMHLLHLSLRISVVGLSNSSATAGRYTRIHLPGNPTYRCSPA